MGVSLFNEILRISRPSADISTPSRGLVHDKPVSIAEYWRRYAALATRGALFTGEKPSRF
jgi:hypothetical protein